MQAHEFTAPPLPFDLNQLLHVFILGVNKGHLIVLARCGIIRMIRVHASIWWPTIHDHVIMCSIWIMQGSNQCKDEILPFSDIKPVHVKGLPSQNSKHLMVFKWNVLQLKWPHHWNILISGHTRLSWSMFIYLFSKFFSFFFLKNKYYYYHYY